MWFAADPTGRLQLAGDAVDLPIIQQERPGPRAFAEPDVGHFQICFPRPLAAGQSPVYGGSTSGYLVESHLARIALRNRVRGQQPRSTAGLEQPFGAQEEIR